MKAVFLMFLALAVMAAGCFSTASIRNASIAGSYQSVSGGFNEQITLELSSDGSYRLEHVFLGCTVDAEGKFDSWGGEDRVKWELLDDRLILRAEKIGTQRSPVFLPAYCGSFRVQRDGLLVSEAVPAIPAATPTRIVLKRAPNQLPDPTSPSGTPPAGAGVAPSVAADH